MTWLVFFCCCDCSQATGPRPDGGGQGLPGWRAKAAKGHGLHSRCWRGVRPQQWCERREVEWRQGPQEGRKAVVTVVINVYGKLQSFRMSNMIGVAVVPLHRSVVLS
jgi:hypothetical protein